MRSVQQTIVDFGRAITRSYSPQMGVEIVTGLSASGHSTPGAVGRLNGPHFVLDGDNWVTTFEKKNGITTIGMDRRNERTRLGI